MKMSSRPIITAIAFAICGTVAAAQLQYPKTRKVDHVDTYHGTKVADPYRWLEDDTSAETAAWVVAQNKVTFPYLEQIPFRAAMHKRVEDLNNYERYTSFSRKGPYVFLRKDNGLQKQSANYIRKGMNGTPEVLIDPSAWGETVALTIFAPSKDAKYAVYGISRDGTDWQELKIMELAPKTTLPDTLQWVKV